MTGLEKISLLPTGIGSMPHQNATDAVDFLAQSVNQFFVWPQLPKISRSEDMTAQYSEGLPGLIYDAENDRYYIDSAKDEFYVALEEFMIDYETIVEQEDMQPLTKYAISPRCASALPYWLEKVKEINPIALKGQVTGPFTYATSIIDQQKKCAFYDETLKETIEKFLALKALWQLQEFKKVAPDALYVISLDEPTISQYGSSAFMTVQKKDIVDSLNAVADVIHKFGGISFTHCCGNTDWSLVTSSHVQILNFDAYNFADSILLYPADIKKFLERNGMLAWGLIPTLDPDQVKEASADNVIEIFEKTIAGLVEKGLDESKIIKQSIITPSCGTGSLDVDLAEGAITLTKQVSNILRSKYSIQCL
jgi:methionine synthase II (cobalamin-independent)